MLAVSPVSCSACSADVTGNRRGGERTFPMGKIQFVENVVALPGGLRVISPLCRSLRETNGSGKKKKKPFRFVVYFHSMDNQTISFKPVGNLLLLYVLQVPPKR